MPANRNSYLRLSHNPELRIFTTVEPNKVLSMQDPYNYISYNTQIATLCKPIENQSLRILENYNKKKDDYFLIEYRKF